MPFYRCEAEKPVYLLHHQNPNTLTYTGVLVWECAYNTQTSKPWFWNKRPGSLRKVFQMSGYVFNSNIFLYSREVRLSKYAECTDSHQRAVVNWLQDESPLCNIY